MLRPLASTLACWLLLSLAAGFAPPPRGRQVALSRRPAFDHLISAEGSVEAPCGCARPDAGFNLTQYMRLPTEQYTVVPMPLGASLLRLDAASFELRPLPMSLLEGTPVEVRVEPRLVARVEHAPERVTISADACELGGSPLIERTGLNDRFRLRVATILEWRDAPRGAKPTICARTSIRVEVDPPAIFRGLPQPVVEASGNFAVRRALDVLQREFLTALAADYDRWATDASYREQRAALAERSDAVNRERLDSSERRQERRARSQIVPSSWDAQLGERG